MLSVLCRAIVNLRLFSNAQAGHLCEELSMSCPMCFWTTKHSADM
jgi:hypothetical protein